MEIRIITAKKEEEKNAALALRRDVFVREQQVPESLEQDEWDETATHFLAYVSDAAVGTARFRLIAPKVAKVERVARPPPLPRARNRPRADGNGRTPRRRIGGFGNRPSLPRPCGSLLRKIGISGSGRSLYGCGHPSPENVQAAFGKVNLSASGQVKLPPGPFQRCGFREGRDRECRGVLRENRTPR